MLLIAACLVGTLSQAQPAPARITKDVSYGEHPRQLLDIYLPATEGVFPVVMFIHGGGWSFGDKTSRVNKDILQRVLDSGCAFVSVEYRFLADGKTAGLFPPVLAPLQDVKSALQFLRLRSKELNIDPERIVAYGNSAGGFSSLWLALSPDMANPKSDNPQERMSTRLRAVAGVNAQTSIDPAQMREWTGPKMKYGCRAFGITSFDVFLKRRDEFAKFYPTLSPAALLSPDDPPVYLHYEFELNDESDNNGYHTHSPRFGIGFNALAKKLGAACILSFPNHEGGEPKEDYVDFLIRHAKN